MSPGISLISQFKQPKLRIAFICAILAISAITSLITHRDFKSRPTGKLAATVRSESILRVQKCIDDYPSSETSSIKHLKSLMSKAEQKSSKK